MFLFSSVSSFYQTDDTITICNRRTSDSANMQNQFTKGTHDISNGAISAFLQKGNPKVRMKCNSTLCSCDYNFSLPTLYFVFLRSGFISS